MEGKLLPASCPFVPPSYTSPLLSKRAETIFRKFKNHSERSGKICPSLSFLCTLKRPESSSTPTSNPRDAGLPANLLIQPPFLQRSPRVFKGNGEGSKDRSSTADMGLRETVHKSKPARRGLLATRKSNCVCEKVREENRLEGL